MCFLQLFLHKRLLLNTTCGCFFGLRISLFLYKRLLLNTTRPYASMTNVICFYIKNIIKYNVLISSRYCCVLFLHKRLLLNTTTQDYERQINELFIYKKNIIKYN